MKATRAIILFVRDEHWEAIDKPLPSGHCAGGYGLINRAIVGRISSALSDRVDLVVVTDGLSAANLSSLVIRQHGSTFGERITNAIVDTFALGYGDVAVIGNDCPGISASDIAAAFDELASGASLVAAPARDGGAFLIAAHADRFDAESFRDLPWRSSRLFTALVALPDAASLPILRDDFDSWRGRRADRALGELLYDVKIAAVSHIPVAPLLSRASIKARTRIFLSSPPSP